MGDRNVSLLVAAYGNDAAAAAEDFATIKDLGETTVVAAVVLQRDSAGEVEVVEHGGGLVAAGTTVGAVAGFALGGGCELAMMCDFVIAADTARFGQPEIKLGIIPGAGGTQRLPRAISKAKAMDMVLTARMMDASEAERAGLVSRVVPAAELIDVAIAAAETICGFSGPSVMMAKEAINRAYETPLSDGIAYERRLFHSLFGTEDKNEGMAAFLAKRKPVFRNR